MYANYAIWDGWSGEPKDDFPWKSTNEKGKFFLGGGIGQHNVMYRENVALRCGCSIPAAEWLDSYTVATALLVASQRVHSMHEGWWCGSSQITMGFLVTIITLHYDNYCGLFHINSTNFMTLFSSTISEFDEIWLFEPDVGRTSRWNHRSIWR